jgi:hypothetical protein
MQTRPSRPHQNKRNDPLLRIILIRWQNVLNIVNNVLMQISVPAEDESQQSATSTHALRGSSTFVPTHAPSGPALSYPLQALEAKHKQPNLINNKEVYTTLISLLKPHTTKIIFINKKRRLTHQNHNIPLLKQFRSCIKE